MSNQKYKIRYPCFFDREKTSILSFFHYQNSALPHVKKRTPKIVNPIIRGSSEKKE